MSKSKKHKNVYVYYTAKDYRYIKVEAIDDNDNHFLYELEGGDHETYLHSAKDMCEKFEKYCTDTCGLDNSSYCNVWTLDKFSPIPIDFTYDSLFDPTALNAEYNEYNAKIYLDYGKYTLSRLIARCDWACGMSLLSEYDLRCNRYIENHFCEQNACGIKAHILAYKEIKKQIKAQYKARYKFFKSVQLRKNEALVVEHGNIIKKVMFAAVDGSSISIAMIQRRFQVGCALAYDIIEFLERHKYISKIHGIEPRKILVTKEDFLRSFEKIETAIRMKHQ